MDMLEYAGEHDDIVIGFEEANRMFRFPRLRLLMRLLITLRAERDAFSEALPAAPQVSRSINFKRKI